MKRGAWWGGGAALTCAAAVAALVPLRQWSAPTDVPTVEVRAGEFRAEIRADGLLQPATATPLSAPAESRGPLRLAWLAPDGSAVHAGDVVIRFDSTDLEKERTASRHDRATSDARIEQKSVRSTGT